jgi:hypothetical protein
MVRKLSTNQNMYRYLYLHEFGKANWRGHTRLFVTLLANIKSPTTAMSIAKTIGDGLITSPTGKYLLQYL